MTVFHQLLGNSLVANITNFTVWFAVTFWVFLETKSVFATGMIAGFYLVLTAALGIWFGGLVDHHRKRLVMMASSLASFVFYGISLALLLAVPRGTLTAISGPFLWCFIVLVLLGVVAGNLRAVALPTLVTALIPEDRRDKANGLVGIVTGVGFVMTSAISGFLVAMGGMEATLGLALAFSALAFGHLAFLRFEEPRIETAHKAPRKIDLAGTIAVIGAVPGLFALILFATFNNLLGGAFMALMDAYGLSLMSVEAWGLLWAVISIAFILAGLIISKIGLGANPVRTIMIVNLIVWSVSAIFTIQSSIALLAFGCFVWMFLGPFAEAAEHTTLQKVVPFERQGRVFGFAQSLESAASPLTAFLIGPLAQFIAIPYMTSGAGADAIGDWYGRGPERGIALVFTVFGALGFIATLLAFNSKSYRAISAAYARPSTPPEQT